MNAKQKIALVLALSAALAGCGLESLLQGATAKDHVEARNVFKGTVSSTVSRVVLVAGDGAEVELRESRFVGNTFELGVRAAALKNLRIRATGGDLWLSTMVFEAAPEAVTEGIVVDSFSTMQVLVLEAKLSAESKSLLNVEPAALRGFWSLVGVGARKEGPTKALAEMVGRLVDSGRADGAGPAMFQTPALSAGYETTTSAIDPAWLSTRQVDFDGDGTPEVDALKFDALLAEVAKEYDFEECLDPNLLRVVFAVNFNDGQKDGNCDAIARFRWVRDEPGKSMFFVGGLHDDSPIQDPLVDAMLGNTGSWVPNQVRMFDDGTNGDEMAGDNVWTVTFALPRGARLGYKYTWGKQGALWTGSEEWPGNQRVLEVVDVNGDDIVYRADSFGDEASNKDKVNLYRRGRGTVTWDTDANGDGIPDARERQADLDNDCTFDEWVTPRAVGPVTMPIEMCGMEGS